MPYPANPHASLAVSTVRALLPLFALIAAGIGARRAGILHHRDSAVLTTFVVQIAFPALIVSTLLTRQFAASDALLPTLYWIVQAAGFAGALALSGLLRLDKASTGAAFVSTFGNTSFIGYPLTEALFPQQMAATVLIDQFGMSLIMYPGLVVLATLYGKRHTDGALAREMLQMLRNPLLGALVVGVCLRAVFDAAPHVSASVPIRVAEAALALLGSATVPVVMVAIGIRLNPSHARRYLRPIVLFGVVKLIVMPMVCFFVGRSLYRLHGPLLSTAVLESAMPQAAAATVFAAEYQMNPELAVASFFVLTMASAATVPIMLTVLR